MKYDIGIIGGGPGGYVAALRGAQLGAKVVLFEKDTLGGTCLNRGCIPTTTLLKSADILRQAEKADKFGVSVGPIVLDYKKVKGRKDSIVSQLTGGVAGLLKKNGVEVIYKEAKIAGKGRIEAEGDIYETGAIILAAGSRPSRPPIPGIEHAVDSTWMLEQSSLPTSMAIVGGGVIGVEFAAAFRAFGVKVTIIEMLPKVLNMADDMVIASAQKLLEREGIEVITGAKVEKIGPCSITYETEEGSFTKAVDVVLAAVGRVPETDGPLLKLLGIQQERGRVVTDSYMRTTVPGIYAIGDVNGTSMLAHTASREGIVAVNHIMGQDTAPMQYERIPSCVYTTPEIAWIGMTEKEAAAMELDYLTGEFPLAGNGKALVEGETLGRIKIISLKKTGEILGAHLVCPHATDMIMEIGACMEAEGTIDDIRAAIHPHPTVSEGMWEAAEDERDMAIHW